MAGVETAGVNPSTALRILDMVLLRLINDRGVLDQHQGPFLLMGSGLFLKGYLEPLGESDIVTVNLTPILVGPDKAEIHGRLANPGKERFEDTHIIGHPDQVEIHQ